MLLTWIISGALLASGIDELFKNPKANKKSLNRLIKAADDAAIFKGIFGQVRLPTIFIFQQAIYDAFAHCQATSKYGIIQMILEADRDNYERNLLLPEDRISAALTALTSENYTLFDVIWTELCLDEQAQVIDRAKQSPKYRATALVALVVDNKEIMMQITGPK